MISKDSLQLIDFYDQLYIQQKEVSDGHLDQFFLQRNEKLLKQVDAFVEESLKGGYAFESLQSHHIHCAAAMLGPLEQELQIMIDSIDNHITKKKDVKVLRLTSDICKRADIKPLIDGVEKANRCIVIVEYTESLLKHQLEENLISSLYKLLTSEIIDKRIMLLFCLLSDATNIDEVYFGVETTMIKTYPNINKEPVKESIDTIVSKLLNMEGVCFELAPTIVDYLSRNFMEVDPSSMELRYLYDFCLLDFYSRPECLVHLPDKELRDCLENMPNLVKSLMNLPSLKGLKLNVPWRNPRKLSMYLRQVIENLKSNHVYLMKQIQHYADILFDSTGEKFPYNYFEIYTELVEPGRENLAESSEMIDAIHSITRSDQKVLITRLETTLNFSENGCDTPLKSRKTENVNVILSKYLGILENNHKSKKNLTHLANELLEHLKNLRNPLTQPFYELFYYKNIESLKSHTIPIVRYSILRERNSNNYYDILNSLVSLEGEFINLKELYENFKDKIENEVGEEEKMKHIFNDKLESMIVHGVIKLIKQGRKKGFAKRMAWL